MKTAAGLADIVVGIEAPCRDLFDDYTVAPNTEIPSGIQVKIKVWTLAL